MLDRHAPLKRKTIRGNQEPFMTKQLSKAIMNRSSKLRNGYVNNAMAIQQGKLGLYKKVKDTMQ